MDAYVDYSSEGELWGDADDEPDDSVLLGFVQAYEWALALERIASHPDECKAVGVQGRTPLHVACDHDAPAQVVAALLKSYPEASLMVGTSSMNPLHITCSSQHASVEVVQVLLEGGLATQTNMRDVDGDTPLHAACRCGAPIETIRVLLEANPSAVNERDHEGLTALLRLWVRCFVMLGDSVLDRIRGPADLTGELRNTWSKTELLLRCAHLGSMSGRVENEQHGNIPSHYTFRPMHAVAAVDCPRPVIKMATVLYPKQLEERDEMGMTPLLIAASAPTFKVRDLSDEGFMLEDRIYGDSDNESDDDMDDGERVDSGQPSVLDILVSANLCAARIPSSMGSNAGQLPLHVAVASGKPWNDGVKTILSAYPEAISRIDPKTGLYPFLQAASTDRPDCGIILELLKKDPTLAVLSPNVHQKAKSCPGPFSSPAAPKAKSFPLREDNMLICIQNSK
ncbi:MAG: hypothetical protein SGILL_003512 [Bacillariaceae sp.]